VPQKVPGRHPSGLWQAVPVHAQTRPPGRESDGDDGPSYARRSPSLWNQRPDTDQRIERFHTDPATCASGGIILGAGRRIYGGFQKGISFASAPLYLPLTPPNSPQLLPTPILPLASS
jgi:hypothetical protein